MQFQLHQLILPVNYKEDDIKKTAARELQVNEKELNNFKVIRRSIDARKKPVFVFLVEFDLNVKIDCKKINNLQPVKRNKWKPIITGLKINTDKRPIVIGAGPAGLMAALVLARNGLKPIIFERGADAETRSRQVREFWEKGVLNTKSNVLYGEGGAGLFSDGKLTARTKDKLGVKYFLETLVKCGAPKSILVDAEPHIGSDVLKEIVPRLRKLIIKSGGNINFNSQAEELLINKNQFEGMIVNGEKFTSGNCILATGHSARDVYRMLADSDVKLEQKSFAAGVRVELPQKIVDQTQWGKFAGHSRLGAASFRLTRKKDRDFRACYTFCMCPGGFVIPCASSEKMFTTNGMSLANRGETLANAAFIVPVTPADYQSLQSGKYPHLAGCEFQMNIEKSVFEAGNNDYSIPVCSLSRFLDKNSTAAVSPNHSFPKIVEADIRSILPEFIYRTLANSIPKMLRIFHYLNYDEVTLYAAETRSSSPVRIIRNTDGQSKNTKGLFPCGEGAGYAGGIVSSALDGIRIAESVIRQNY